MREDLNQENDRNERPEEGRRRHGAPRLGSFVTIAVAILFLFGAASRMGKPAETVALFNIDQTAETRLRNEEARARTEEERLRTFLTLGTVPASERAEAEPAGMIIDRNPPPVYRGEFDLEEQRRINRAAISMAVPDKRGAAPEAVGAGESNVASAPGPEDASPVRAGLSAAVPDGRAGHDPVPEGTASPASRHGENSPASYVDLDGDTWVKIAKNTLGDAKRWQDIQNANPPARGGLRVGMRLTIPQ